MEIRSLAYYGLQHWLSLNKSCEVAVLQKTFGLGVDIAISELIDDGIIVEKNGIIKFKRGKKNGLLGAVAEAIAPYKGRKCPAVIALHRLQLIANKQRQSVSNLIDDLREGIARNEAWRTKAHALNAAGHKVFIPEQKHLTTYINQQCWGDTLPELPELVEQSDVFKRYKVWCERMGLKPMLTDDQVQNWVEKRGPFQGVEMRASEMRRKSIFAEAHAKYNVYENLISLANIG